MMCSLQLETQRSKYVPHDGEHDSQNTLKVKGVGRGGSKGSEEVSFQTRIQ